MLSKIFLFILMKEYYLKFVNSNLNEFKLNFVNVDCPFRVGLLKKEQKRINIVNKGVCLIIFSVSKNEKEYYLVGLKNNPLFIYIFEYIAQLKSKNIDFYLIEKENSIFSTNLLITKKLEKINIKV